MSTDPCPIQSRQDASILLDYLDRRLSAEAMAEMDRHAAACASCRQAIQMQRQVWAALDGWEPEPVSAHFNRRLYERIEAENRKPWWNKAAGWLTAKPAFPAAALAMAVVAVLLLRMPPAGSPESTKAKLDSVVDIEQVDRTLDEMEMLRQLGVAADEAPPRAL